MTKYEFETGAVVFYRGKKYRLSSKTKFEDLAMGYVIIVRCEEEKIYTKPASTLNPMPKIEEIMVNVDNITKIENKKSGGKF